MSGPDSPNNRSKPKKGNDANDANDKSELTQSTGPIFKPGVKPLATDPFAAPHRPLQANPSDEFSETDGKSGPRLFPKPAPQASKAKPDADPIVDLFKAVHQAQKRDQNNQDLPLELGIRNGWFDGLLEGSAAKKILIVAASLGLMTAFVFGMGKLIALLSGHTGDLPGVEKKEATEVSLPRTDSSPPTPSPRGPRPGFTPPRFVPKAEPANRVEDIPSFLPREDTPLNDDMNENTAQPPQLPDPMEPPESIDDVETSPPMPHPEEPSPPNPDDEGAPDDSNVADPVMNDGTVRPMIPTEDQVIDPPPNN